MRTLIDIVERKPSRYGTQAPEHIGGRAATPIGQYLFHGTTLIGAISILRDGEISPGIEWRGEGKRVSLTRSYNVAKEFGTYGDFGYMPVVLVLDWKRLVWNFVVRPHADPHCDGSERNEMAASEDGTEQEEACYGAIRPLGKYLVSVNVTPEAFEAALSPETVVHIQSETDWNGKRFQASVRKLMTSPILNRVMP